MSAELPPAAPAADPAAADRADVPFSQPRGTPERRLRVALIAALIVVATALHYGIDLREGAVHDVLTRSYYLPIVLAGLWFGARGGFLAAASVTVVFFPHALHGWDAPYTFVFRLIEILMYFVIGILTGAMSSRASRSLLAERRARLQRETALADKDRALHALTERTRQVFSLEEQVRRTERLAALGKLSAGLAHEIRNPLGSIRTAVEVLADRTASGDDAEDAETAELFEVIVEETDRLNRTLTAFLDFARTERGDAQSEPARAGLREAVEHVSGLMRARLETRAIVLDVDADALDVAVAVPPSHLRQVFVNLVLNSAEAVDRGGRVAVRLHSRSADTVRVAVEDDGPGLPAGLGDEIFDPFVSATPGGTGLGLSVVARILDVAGGAIEFDRTVAAGARALVTLPVAAP